MVPTDGEMVIGAPSGRTNSKDVGPTGAISPVKKNEGYVTVSADNNGNNNPVYIWVFIYARKLVFWVCEVQRRRPACASAQLFTPLLFTYWKVSYLKMLPAKFQFSS